MEINYRLNLKEDNTQLVQFWSEHSGWDQVDQELWARRFLSTPMGESCIAIAEEREKGEIVGQFIFIPWKVHVGSKIIKAIRPFAPILSQSLRSATLTRGLLRNPMAHPIARMYLTATNELIDRGFELAYIMPNPKWATVFRLLPNSQFAWFPLLSRQLPLPEIIEHRQAVTCRVMHGWDDRVESLAQISASHYGCALVRDRTSFPWKLSHAEYDVLLVERGSELIGLSASQHKGDRQWLICDLLALDLGDCLRETLACACNHAHQKCLDAPKDQPLCKVSVLATPPMLWALYELGFSKDAYRFPLVTQRLGDSLSKGETDPKKWYVSAND